MKSGPDGKSGGAAPYRVLVVDDNLDSAESLGMLIEIWGHEARMAHDGNAALAIAAEFRPEVVLLDIGLPGLSGYDVATMLRAQPDTAGAILVAMTGYGQDDDRRRSREAGFSHHLVKPVDADALRRFLEDLGGSANR